MGKLYVMISCKRSKKQQAAVLRWMPHKLLAGSGCAGHKMFHQAGLFMLA